MWNGLFIYVCVITHVKCMSAFADNSDPPKRYQDKGRPQHFSMKERSTDSEHTKVPVPSRSVPVIHNIVKENDTIRTLQDQFSVYINIFSKWKEFENQNQEIHSPSEFLGKFLEFLLATTKSVNNILDQYGYLDVELRNLLEKQFISSMNSSGVKVYSKNLVNVPFYVFVFLIDYFKSHLTNKQQIIEDSYEILCEIGFKPDEISLVNELLRTNQSFASLADQQTPRITRHSRDVTIRSKSTPFYYDNYDTIRDYDYDFHNAAASNHGYSGYGMAHYLKDPFKTIAIIAFLAFTFPFIYNIASTLLAKPTIMNMMDSSDYASEIERSIKFLSAVELGLQDNRSKRSIVNPINLYWTQLRLSKLPARSSCFIAKHIQDNSKDIFTILGTIQLLIVGVMSHWIDGIHPRILDDLMNEVLEEGRVHKYENCPIVNIENY